MTESLNILVAEDELLVQAVACQVLEDRGFHVLSASSTEEAIEIVEHEPQIDAVLLDIDIGDVGGGYRVARRVRDLHPAAPIIYTSGGAQEVYERERVPDADFVAKPYSLQGVCALIEKRLAIAS